MLVVGLTGGIGSGKSTVAKLFEDRGVTVIDTDVIAREVTVPGKPALLEIVAKFGTDLLHTDGNLNRMALRKIVFDNEEKRRWLEKLLHPLIRAEVQTQVTAAAVPYCIVVIPLLLETEPNPIINRILVIDAKENDQLKRTQIRDNLSPAEVNAIIYTQVSRQKRLAAADDIICNTKGIPDLIVEVDRLHNFYLALANSQARN